MDNKYNISHSELMEIREHAVNEASELINELNDAVEVKERQLVVCNEQIGRLNGRIDRLLTENMHLLSELQLSNI